MRGLTSLTAGLALLTAAWGCGKDPAAPIQPVVTSLSCEDGATPGSYVGCTLKLTAPAGFKVRLVSSECRAHGNVFRITAPVVDTLVKDGCYAAIGTEIIHAEPFQANTEISAEVIAPLLDHPPQLRVTGNYSDGWTLTYEDGEDDDFNDLVLVLTAIPQAP